MMLNFKLYIKKLLLNLGFNLERIKIKKIEIVSQSKLDNYYLYKKKRTKKREGKKVDCNQIYEFLDKVDLFYNKSIIEPLKIEGAWKNFLKLERKIQNKIYENKNSNEIIKFHENMFYNELTTGLINYSNFKDVTNLILNKFDSEYNNFIKIFNYPRIIFSNLPIKRWGIKKGDNILTFNDLWHTEQAIIIKNFYNILKKKKNIFFLEIGSGYGGMVEKLDKFKIFKKFFLVDIPHNLLTTYYYLSKIFGSDKVCLINNKNFIPFLNNSKIKFFLIPTIFLKEIKNINNDFIFSNSGSFSEMNTETINYYIRNLPANTLGLISNNSNVNQLNFDNHIEIINDDINFKGFKLIYEGHLLSAAVTNRYKSKIFLKDF